MEADNERIKRAGAKFDQHEASLLRAMAHGWLAVDEVTIINSGAVAQQVLAALDALAIVHGTEQESAKQDEVLRRVNRLETEDDG